MAIDPQFFSAGSFSEGLAAAKDASGLFGYVDASGDLAIEPAFSDRIASNEEDNEFLRWLVPAKSADGNLWGFVNSSGSWIFEPQFVNVGL